MVAVTELPCGQLPAVAFTVDTGTVRSCLSRKYAHDSFLSLLFEKRCDYNFKIYFFRYLPVKTLNHSNCLCLPFSFSSQAIIPTFQTTPQWNLFRVLVHFLVTSHFLEMHDEIEPPSDFNFFLFLVTFLPFQEGSSRNMYKGHMDKAKGGQDQGWEVEMGRVGGVVRGKLRQLYLNNNKKT